MLSLDFDPVALALMWLLIGSLVWMLHGPFRITDAVMRGWVRRHDRLPPRGAILLAHVIAILVWPRVVDHALMLERRR